MFAWFQRLLPQTGDFFGMFEAHAATVVGAAEALQQLTTDGHTPRQILEIFGNGNMKRTRSSARY